MKKSDSIKELATALAKANGEISRIAKDANNPFFKNKYASLDTIVDEVRPILQKHGLSVMQFPSGDGKHVSMTTLLLHESGEWLESEALTMEPVKNDPQAVGSCITYARRYSLNAFLNLNTGEDDDGNQATHNKSQQQQQKPQQQYPKTKDQHAEYNDKLKRLKHLVQQNAGVADAAGWESFCQSNAGKSCSKLTIQDVDKLLSQLEKQSA